LYISGRYNQKVWCHSISPIEVLLLLLLLARGRRALRHGMVGVRRLADAITLGGLVAVASWG
jgi:hypothetical protein